MNTAELFNVIHEQFRWPRIHRHVEQIYAGDHFFSNDGFLKTAAYCLNAFQKAGLSQAEALPLKADGKTRYGDWVIPRAWTARSAALSYEDGEIIASYEAVPCSLVMYSAPTGKDGIAAGVVIVDDIGENKNVEGKLILTRLHASLMAGYAKKGGAVGVITDFIPLYKNVRDSREEMSGHSCWVNDFCVPVNDTGLFGFSLSPEAGKELRRRISENEGLTLKAHVDTEFFDGILPTISACIPGTDPEAGEILIYGHLYEPGANDNASGSALILELAGCVQTAINEGRLPRPKRTLRFGVGQECMGSTGYLLSHPDRRHKAALVCDMVGSEVNDRSMLSIWHNPLSNFSFTDVLLIRLLEAYQRDCEPDFVWEERRFGVGTDNMTADPIWNMPTVAMITEPALSYHSSMDTPDRMEEPVLRRNTAIAGAMLLTLANFDEAAEKALTPEIEAFFQNARTAFGARLREKVIKDMRAFYDNSAESVPLSIALPENSQPEYARVPVRSVMGCLTFAGLPALADSKWQPAWNTRVHIPLFWADGKRSVWEIACLTAKETGAADPAACAEEILEFFRLLNAHGYIEWR